MVYLLLFLLLYQNSRGRDRQFFVHLQRVHVHDRHHLVIVVIIVSLIAVGVLEICTTHLISD